MRGMEKAEAIKLFGTAAALAEALGISRSAVAQWGETVPKLREFQIRELRPTATQPRALEEQPS